MRDVVRQRDRLPRSAAGWPASGRPASCPAGVGSPVARTRAYHEILARRRGVAGSPPGGEPDPIYGNAVLTAQVQARVRVPRTIIACDVHSNDLGFLVVAQRSARGINVVGGRRHGAHPRKRTRIHELADTLGFAKTGEVREVAEAVVNVQRDHGNRSDRRHGAAQVTCSTSTGPGLVSRGRWTPDRSPARAAGFGPGVGHRGPPRVARPGKGRSFLGVFVENGRIRDDADRRCGARCAAWSRLLERAFASRLSRTCVNRHPRPAAAAGGPDPG